MLSLLNHPNLIKLIGYCNEGHERLLVHEYLPLGSLDQHLHGKLSASYTLLSAGAVLGPFKVHDRLGPRENRGLIY